MPKEFWTGDRLIKLGQLTQKKTVTELAQHFGKSISSIKQVCKQYGLKPCPGKKGGRKKSMGVPDSIDDLLRRKLI